MVGFCTGLGYNYHAHGDKPVIVTLVCPVSISANVWLSRGLQTSRITVTFVIDICRNTINVSTNLKNPKSDKTLTDPNLYI